jgi:hypothetical protein
LQTFEQRRDGHNHSPDHQRPRPSKADKQRDSEIANEVVELPTELGAGGPFGRAEGGDYEQDHDRPAANFCAGTKTRFYIRVHCNAPTAVHNGDGRIGGAMAQSPEPRVPPFTFFRGCGQFALFNRHTISDHYPSRVVGWGSVMGLDTGTVFKRSVSCPHCNEDYLFTLRAIADNPELKCLGCGGSIRLSDSAYERLLSEVRNTLEAIDSAQLAPTFISAQFKLAV